MAIGDPNNINVAFVEQFRQTVHHRSQQQGSRLGNLVYRESLVGEVHNFERLEPEDAQYQGDPTNGGVSGNEDSRRDPDGIGDPNGRHADSPVMNAQHSRVQVNPWDTEWGDLVDREDKLRMIISPESEYVKLAANSLGRQKDDQIIAAFDGDIRVAGQYGNFITQSFGGAAASGVKADGGTEVTDNGDGNGLSLDNILEALENLQTNEAYENEEIIFVYGPRQERDVRSIVELTSSDFVTTGGMMARGVAGPSGGVASTGPLGITWVRSARLQETATDSGIRKCFMYAKSAMGLAVNEDMYSYIAPRADKKNAWQVFCRQTLGATRIDGTGVVRVLANENPAP